MTDSPGGPSGHPVAEVVVRLSAIDPHPTFQVPERSVVLDKNNPTMSIGRASKNKGLDCDMINCWFDSPVMSRKHAQLEVDLESKAVFLVDTGSLHGTFLNDRRLGKDERVRLVNNDEARLGVEIVQGNKTFPPCRLRIGVVWADGHPLAVPPPAIVHTTPTFQVPDSDSDVDSSDPCPSDSDVEEIDSVSRTSQQQNPVIDLTEDPAIACPPDVVDLTSPAREPSVDAGVPTSLIPDPNLAAETVHPPPEHPSAEIPASDVAYSPMSPSYSPLSPESHRSELVDSPEVGLAGYSGSDLDSLDDESQSVDYSSPLHSRLGADDAEPPDAAAPLLPEFPATEGLGVTDTAVWGEDDSEVSGSDEPTESEPEYDDESLSDSGEMSEDGEYDCEEEPVLPPLECVAGLPNMTPAVQPETASLTLPPLMDNAFSMARQPSPSDAAMPKTIRTRFPGLEATPSMADILGLKTGKYDFFVAREANKKLVETFESPRLGEPSTDIDYGMPHNLAFPGGAIPCLQPSSGCSSFPTLEATTSDFRTAHLVSQAHLDIQQPSELSNYQTSPDVPGTSSFGKEEANEVSMHNKAYVPQMQVNLSSENTENVSQTPKRSEHATLLLESSRRTHVGIDELVDTTQAMRSTKDSAAYSRESSPVPQQKPQGFPGDTVLLSFMDNHRRKSVSDLPLVKSREGSAASEYRSPPSKSRETSPDSCDDSLASTSPSSESREDSPESRNLSAGFAPATSETMKPHALAISSSSPVSKVPAVPPTLDASLHMANPGAKRKRTEEVEDAVIPATALTSLDTPTPASSQHHNAEPEARPAKKRHTTLGAIGYAALGAVVASAGLFTALVTTAPNFDE